MLQEQKCSCGCGRITNIQRNGKYAKFILGHNNKRQKNYTNSYLQKQNKLKNTKWCSYCLKYKEYNEFAKSKRNKDGLTYGCKECRSALASKYQKENPDKVNEKNRNWYHTDENGKRVHKQKISNNPQLYKNISRKRSQTRRAREKNAFVEYVDPISIFERDEGICGICYMTVDLEEDWEVDHILPLSLGGLHTLDNVQLAHKECNRIKGDAPTLVLSGSWEFRD